MSRTIFGAALGLVLAFACGCGSKPAPTPPGEPAPAPEPKKDPGSTATADPPKTDPPKAELPKVAWEMDPDKHAVPAAPVRGRVAGVEVTPEAVVTAGEVAFRVGKAEAPDRAVSIKLAPGDKPGQARTLKVKPADPPGPNVPEVWVESKGEAIRLYPSGYALTLDLAARKDGKVAGKVYLSLQDKDESVLAGTFSADYFRPHTEKPGPDDAPYITGEVAVTGADPKAEIRIAYAAFLPDGGVALKELQLPPDPAPVEQARWTRDDTDLPASSTLVPGDGKGRPFRYEHTRLKPGRYLVSAAVVGGPAVWKWVDVPAGGALTENLALDASKTGGLEISAAPGATGKVFVAPADDDGRPPLDARLFEALSIQVVRTDVEVVGGKAVVKNLGTGRYEVRLGGERRLVDVVPGKTAEVSLLPKK